MDLGTPKIILGLIGWGGGGGGYEKLLATEQCTMKESK